MKKFKHIILLLCAGLLLLQIPVFAAGNGSLKAAQVTGKPGEEVRVAITLETNPGLIAARIGVQYDPAIVALVRAENGTVFADDLALFGKVPAANPYYLLWEDALGASNNTKTGTLAVLVFRILDTAQGKSAVRLLVDQGSVFNYDLKEVPLKATDGSITVKGAASTKTTATTAATTAATTQSGAKNDTTAASNSGGLSVVPKESEVEISDGMTNTDTTTGGKNSGTGSQDTAASDEKTGDTENASDPSGAQSNAQEPTQEKSAQKQGNWKIYAIIGAAVLLLAVVLVLLKVSKKQPMERGNKK